MEEEKEKHEKEEREKKGHESDRFVHSFLTSETETNEFLRVLGRSRE